VLEGGGANRQEDQEVMTGGVGEGRREGGNEGEKEGLNTILYIVSC